jgi:protein gp37
VNKTPIEWTDFSVNPFRFRNRETGKVGHHCTKISPGCKNCYSGKMQEGPYLSGLAFVEENKPKGEFFLDEAVLEQVLRRKKPCRIFWWDMTDGFLEDYPDEWIDRCFAVMALTPHLTHQVLTKRAKRMREYMTGRAGRYRETAQIRVMKEAGERASYWRNSDEWDAALDRTPWPLPNVWLGVSVEDQQRKSRIDELRDTPAAIRFLSLEPLLEDLGALDLRGIHQAIIGGESGPEARPMDLAWARSIVAQCKAAGVAPFFKQAGAKPWDSLGASIDHPFAPCGHPCRCCDECSSNEGQRDEADHPPYLKLCDKKGGDLSELPADLQVREYPHVEL